MGRVVALSIDLSRRATATFAWLLWNSRSSGSFGTTLYVRSDSAGLGLRPARHGKSTSRTRFTPGFMLSPSSS